MESYDFSIKSTKKIVAFNSTQKNNVNMIFECDASRLAIYISLGHRDTILFLNFTKKTKTMKIWKSLYRQKVPELIGGWFFILVFATRDLQNDMFC